MLQLPTGAGKTRIAAEIIKRAVDKRKRVAFTVPAISLIDQTVAAFEAEASTALA
jgi:DNA repair protein RadD